MVNKEELRDCILATIENLEWYVYDHDLEKDNHYRSKLEGMRELRDELFKEFDLYTYAKPDEQVSSE